MNACREITMTKLSTYMDTAKVREKVDASVKFLQKHVTGLVIGVLLLVNVVLLLKLSSPNMQVSERGERELNGKGPQFSSGGSRGGALFTRWGRTECPKEEQFVYEGFVAGAHYTHTGSGSNYLCLPKDPIFEKIIAGVQNPAIVYGAEYQLGANSFGAFQGTNAEALHDHNVPCAVCRSTERSTTLMIPARSRCYEGWTAEYHGYLMATHHTYKGKSEFVCVDNAPEADPAGYRNEDGTLFYHVEGACGSLRCPPYTAGKELTCVVCTI